MRTKLEEILLRKEREIASIPSRSSLKQVLKKGEVQIIAEIKRRSPSQCLISEIKDPLVLAESYIQGGAAAISVLTDELGFGGHLRDLKCIADHYPNLPLLRKDFILDVKQLKESLIAGASTVLLMVSLLKEKTAYFFEEARQLGLEALVEVHNEKELEVALDAKADLIGVNNRDLSTLQVDISTAERLAPLIPGHVFKVAESGIRGKQDVQRMKAAGYDALLIGGALAGSSNPEKLLKEFLTC